MSTHWLDRTRHGSVPFDEEDPSFLLTSSSAASTVSTVTTDSSLTPPPLMPSLEDDKDNRTDPIPPREVDVHPEPVPYAQLCLNQERNKLVALLVGGARSNYAKLMSSGDDDDKDDPSVDPSNDWSLSWSSSSFSSWSSSDAISSGSGTSGASPNPATKTTTTNKTALLTSQDIIWVDGSWMIDDVNEYAELHRALLWNETSTTDQNEPDDAVVGLGCGHYLRWAVPQLLVFSSHKDRYGQHHCSSRSHKYSGALRSISLPTRFQAAKHCRYHNLH